MWQKPWLLLSPQIAHDLSPYFVDLASHLVWKRRKIWNPLFWRHLHFPNRLGISGGLDKNARSVEAWWRFGCGFVEAGTITPNPQGPNPGTILMRDIQNEALWNKMGFPNDGLNAVLKRVKDLPLPHPSPLFINIGKNRTTAIEDAADDYIALMNAFREHADGFVINISSPNTEGLRKILSAENLPEFLQKVLTAKSQVPCFLKISPDIEPDELRIVLDASLASGIDGWILTNTSSTIRSGLHFPADGGVSGRPLARRSTEILKFAVNYLGDRREDRLIVSCGGVMSPENVLERLSLGADLVQVYTALVFHGPWFFSKVARASKKQERQIRRKGTP